MSRSENLIKCSKCNMLLIAEELETHQCFIPKDVWVIEGEIWVSDGRRGYRYPPKGATRKGQCTA